MTIAPSAGLTSTSDVKQPKTKHNAKGRIVKRGKLKVWVGKLPPISVADTIEFQRLPRVPEVVLRAAIQKTSTGGLGLSKAETTEAIRAGRK